MKNAILLLLQILLLMSAVGGGMAGVLWLFPKLARSLSKKILSRQFLRLIYFGELMALVVLIIPFWLLPPLAKSHSQPILLETEQEASLQKQITDIPLFPSDITPNADIGKELDFTGVYEAIGITVACVLFCGFLIIGLRSQIKRRRLLRLLRFSGLSEEKALNEIYVGLCGELSIKKPPGLLISEKVDTPMLIGLIKPCIFIPNTVFPTDTLRLILRHELIHYSRGDLWIKAAAQLAVCVHWFNPIAWGLERDIGHFCECFCDERVALELDHERRKAYGRAVLNATENSSKMCEALYFGGVNRIKRNKKENVQIMKERLINIFNVKKPSKASIIVSICVAGMLLAGGVTICLAASPKLPEVFADFQSGQASKATITGSNGHVDIITPTSTKAVTPEENTAADAVAVAVAVTEEKPLDGMTVVLDAGHGGTDTGSLAGEVYERELNLLMASSLKDEMTAQGANVIMIRSDNDTTVALLERVKTAEAAKPDLLISCHYASSSAGHTDFSGHIVYYQTEKSSEIAQRIEQNLRTLYNNDSDIDSKNGQAKKIEELLPLKRVVKKDFKVLRSENYPSAEIEFGFMQNENDVKASNDSESRAKAAKAVCAAIASVQSKK